MGLDMYLEKTPKNVSEDVGYWRKANQIFDWFERHCCDGSLGNCQRIWIDKYDIEKLKEDCEIVLADHSKAEEIMPISEGFFFGSTKYDEWYFEELERTVGLCEEVLQTVDFDKEELTFYAWW